MIKYIFFIILLVPSVVFAAGASHIGGVPIANISNVGGVDKDNISSFGGVAVGSGESSCPSYYADANVTFSWDGDHDSGTKYGCKADGSTILGTGSLTPNTDYGESGSYGVSLDGTNGLIFATSGDAQINDEIGTVWLRIKYNGDPDNWVVLFEGAESGDISDSLVMILADASNQLRCYWSTPTTIGVVNAAIATGNFVDIAYSWDYTNGDHQANDGNGWAEDVDEIGSTPLADFDEIVIGEDNFAYSSPGAGNYVYIDRIVILSTYGAAVPTNW